MHAHDSLILIYGNAVEMAQALRIALQNQHRSLVQANSASVPEAKRLAALVKAARSLELHAIRELTDVMQHGKYWPFIKARFGIGEKGMGLLLATIGDPADRDTPSQLWQYCGHGDPERSRRRKGTNELGFSPAAKTALWNVAKSASNQGPYRAVYLKAYADAETKVHAKQCQNTIRPVAGKANGSNGCGTQAQPELGAPGSPWRKGHKNAHAIRVVGKAILLDLWREARGDGGELLLAA